MKLVKILKSPYWDLLPFAVLILVTITEGKTYPVAGVAAIMWLFIVAVRYLVPE
jgi:hypothetical protein